VGCFTELCPITESKHFICFNLIHPNKKDDAGIAVEQILGS
jgi:hypothetical protein